MSDVTSLNPGTNGLIADLVADLQPVKRLPSPWLRAALWLGIVVVLACALATVADLSALRHRLMGAPDMWLAVLGSTATAGLAAIAAFQLGLPDRGRAWALLPLPGLALWLGASGLGCARTWFLPETHGPADGKDCMMFIIGLSVPLTVVMFAMLRRGYSLYPSLAGAVGGLAVAAAAATLLNFFHPFDAAITDLAVHATAVALVVGANRLLGGAILAPRRRARA
ncbi:NrsF family protein [Beijerinckia sp. L45]|uniref:NrsF family protein n=1 Tax=Beijerinckia sp. L45 TaxID=1641855 RepID=UPI00131D18B3|nr:NrsF family protein [Beijerinckia sp. L45]